MNRDPEMRARDVDRARTVEMLEAAYVDGQVDSEEREARVSAAMGARTLGDLDRLVADLQSDSPVRQPPSDVGPWLWRVGVGVAAVLLVAVGWRIVAGGSDDATSTASGSATQPAAGAVETSEQGVLWSDVKKSLAPLSTSQEWVQVAGIGRWNASMSDITHLIDAYRERNGGYIAGASFYPEYGSIEQPLKGSLPGKRTWSFYPHDPVLRSSSATTVSARDMTLIDLDDLDLDRLSANLDHALADLNVEDAQLSYISVSVSSGAPGVNIYVENKYSERAYLNTTTSGEITSESEFSGA